MNALDLFRLDGRTAIVTGGGRGLENIIIHTANRKVVRQVDVEAWDE